MSYFVSKIGHLEPRFYSLIYCAIPGVQMSGVQMSGVQMFLTRLKGQEEDISINLHNSKKNK